MHGTEGEDEDYSRGVSDHTGLARHNNHDVHYGYIYAMQHDEYEFRAVAKDEKKRPSSGTTSGRAPECSYLYDRLITLSPAPTTQAMIHTRLLQLPKSERTISLQEHNDIIEGY